MTDALLILTIVVPLALAGLDLLCRIERPWLPVVGTLPGLACAATVPPGVVSLDLDWFFLGAHFELDVVGRWFLGVSALLWLIGGVYAVGYFARDPHRRRHTRLFLLTMAGNLGVTVAGDALSYLLLFALMSFSAYGLVVHSGTDPARRAGRTYLTLVVASEVALFTVLVLLQKGGSASRFPELRHLLATHTAAPWLVGLVVAGFGIKLGLVPLHFWLPLAHPAAPTPASAVLSGAIIKTGLLGWLRLLPLGLPGNETWGMVLLALGFGGAFYGVVVGFLQTDTKTVLAYSSVSQMGLLIAAVGAGLSTPESWSSLAEGAVLVYVLHHAVTKSGLFFTVGILRDIEAGRRRWLAQCLLLALAAAMAGFPATSGSWAKSILKAGMVAAGAEKVLPVTGLLTLSSCGTALLMGHLVLLARKTSQSSHGHPTASQWLPVAATVMLVVAAPLLGMPWGGVAKTPSFLAGTWPLLAGFGLAFLLQGCGRGQIPAGDVLHLGAAITGRFGGGRDRATATTAVPGRKTILTAEWRRTGSASLEFAEETLRSWPVAGTLVVGVILCLWWLLRN